LKPIRILVVALMAVGFLAATAASASATTFTVHNGDSIQAAINAAHKGDLINIDKGTYTENLSIRGKSGLRLNGHHSLLVPPSTPTKNICVDNTGFPGICVVGQVDKNFNVVNTLDNVQIDGMTIDGFSHEGIFAYGTAGLTVSNSMLRNNGGYGVFSLNGSLVSYLGNVAHDNGDAGFYIGESPSANVTVNGNESYKNRGEGILFRDSRGGTISNNNLHDNCSGVLLLDTGTPAPGGDVLFRDNIVNRNNQLCPAAEGPPLGGIGVAVVGDDHANVRNNTITNNHQQSGSAFGGGLLLLDSSGFGGRPPNHNTLAFNTLSNNTPFDIFDDGSGTGNNYNGNSCATSNNGQCV
jgi:parallel beta-helix repeat protein